MQNNTPSPHTNLAAQAQKILSDDTISLADGINGLLQPLISTFKAISAQISGNHGELSEHFSTVIYDGRDITAGIVPIDAVAMVIDLYDKLTIDNIQAAYQRIAFIKALSKSDVPNPSEGEVFMTTCAIVGKSSSLTLEQIAEEMERLTSNISSYQWPDIIAVLSKGIVNYTAHVPGSEKNGDFFLPAMDTAEQGPVPSVYVNKTIRSSADHTFNKIAAFAMQRVGIFKPGIKLPGFKDITENLPSHGGNTQSYQFNLANQLRPMTHEEAIQSQLPQDTYNIVSNNEVLGSVQFRTWQDGGIFIVRGNFPLDIFLIFLRQVVSGLSSNRLQFFRNPGIQVSFVLPINKAQFLKTLDVFQRSSSNIHVQMDVTKILVRKLADEGTSTPFFARLMMGIFDTQNIVSNKKADRDHFFDLYNPVMANLRSAREAAKDIKQVWKEHQDKVKSGAIVAQKGRTVQIGESIDRRLKRELDSFLTATGRATKNALQKLTKDMGVDIGCFFQTKSEFEKGIKKTRASDPMLADYLIAARTWSEPLQKARNTLEHGVFPEPEVQYDVNTTPVQITEPTVDSQPITQYVESALDRVCCFIEEITTYCLQKRMPPGISVAEIPTFERAAEAPVRFKLTFVPGGPAAWVLTAHTHSFENA